MLKAYKYRIYPNKQQQILLNKTFGCCRLIYNHMLHERIAIYEQYKDDKEQLKAIKYTTEKKLKQQYNFLKEIDSIALQQSRLNLDIAYKNFFRGIKKNQKVGFPKYKAKRNKQSYRTVATNNNLKINFSSRKIKVPKIGWINYRDKRTFDASIKQMTISKDTSGNYYCSMLVDTNDKAKNKVQTISKVIALDMSAKDFAVSEEKQFTNPKFYRNNEKRLALLSKRLSRKQKGSNNINKARQRLAKNNQIMLNKKRDWLHKLSTELVNSYDAIIIEDLALQEMQQLSSGFSKTITLDFNWGEFVNMLSYKAEWQGKHLVKVSRWFASSKICNHCGAKKEELRLNDREWVCKECGSINDRDINASKNIKEEGLRLLNMAGTVKINALRDMLPVTEAAGEATSFRS